MSWTSLEDEEEEDDEGISRDGGFVWGEAMMLFGEWKMNASTFFKF